MTTLEPQLPTSQAQTNSSLSKKVKNGLIGLGVLGALALGAIGGRKVYGRLSNSKYGNATGKTFTTKATANLTLGTGGTSGRGSMGVVLAIVGLLLLGAIALYWWLSRRQDEQNERYDKGRVPLWASRLNFV